MVKDTASVVAETALENPVNHNLVADWSFEGLKYEADAPAAQIRASLVVIARHIFSGQPVGARRGRIDTAEYVQQLRVART